MSYPKGLRIYSYVIAFDKFNEKLYIYAESDPNDKSYESEEDKMIIIDEAYFGLISMIVFKFN